MFETIRLRYSTGEWQISHLIALHESQKLNLCPHYQRNSIWSLRSQRSLIATIQDGQAMPNFFIRVLPNGKYEVVDGQQRSRSIIDYWNGGYADSQGEKLSPELKRNPSFKEALDSFLSYPLSITLLDETFTDEEIQAFYTLVNSAGMRLNRPELFKAQFYSTKFLKLATELAGSPFFEDLSLFSEKSSERMNDIDFVSELLAFLQFGFSDKKEKVDSLYETDITDKQYADLRGRAEETLARVSSLDSVAPVSRTRFKQKGDFYTLFAFIASNPGLSDLALRRFYQIFLKLAPDIRPSQENCDPLRDYAVNCVTQSNSKKAREARNRLFDELFLNSDRVANSTQSMVAAYLGLVCPDDYEIFESYFVYRIAALETVISR